MSYEDRYYASQDFINENYEVCYEDVVNFIDSMNQDFYLEELFELRDMLISKCNDIKSMENTK